MRHNCRCDLDLDYATKRIMAQALHDALFKECLVFRKNTWIIDCGFIQEEQLVELPRNYELRETKVAFCKKCISLLDEGWVCDYASEKRERMEQMIREYTDE